MSQPSLRLIAPALLLSLAACASTSGNADSSKAAPDANQAKPENDADKQQKIAAVEEKIAIAKIEAEIGQISSDSAVKSAELDLERAKRELEEARRALDHFKGFTVPVEMEEAKMNHDRSVHRADEANDELRELESMYKTEEFAEMTKELVLKRGRRQLELAQRGLKVSETRLADKKDDELPRKERDLVDDHKKAEEKVAKQEIEVQKARLSAKVSAMKSAQKMEELERELKDAKEGKAKKGGDSGGGEK